MVKNIDYNRGVMKQTAHASGVNVYMYIDQPGVFLSAHGTPVSQKLAEEAGYNVADLTKKKQMNERIAEAHAAIRREFEQNETVNLIVAERQGFKVKDIGLGRFQVLDPDDVVMTKEPLSRELATAVLNQLAPGGEDQPEQ
jgi:hypothetical protein